MSIGKTLLCGLLVFAAGAAVAAEPEDRFELTPFAGYTIGGDFEDADTGSRLEFDDAGSADWWLDH